MKKIIFGLLVLILVLASCKAPEPIIVEKVPEVLCPDQYMRIGTTCCLDANENAICDSDEKIETPVETEEPLKPDTETSDVLKSEEIYDKAVKATAMGYAYSVLDEKFFIRNNRMKILFGDYVKLGYDYEKSRLNIIDTAYLNLDTKYAFGVCTGRFFKSSVWDKTCSVIKGIRYPLYFGDYYYKTPMDWLEQFKGKKHTHFREYDKEIRGRYTDIIIFEQGSERTTMWIDHKTGLPIRINVENMRDNWTKEYVEYANLVFYIEPEEVVYG
ncbi:hypothetical protein GF358_02325 [Candidatus Woesearchaeota archaeon]|nr:hypothetical protein [Candidatus Woesearchaeota archaeon]